MPIVEKRVGGRRKLWHSKLTYIYPQCLIMRGTDYIFYTEITKLGRWDHSWKTDSALNGVEVCRSMPETGIQSGRISALLPEGGEQRRGLGVGSVRFANDVMVCRRRESLHTACQSRKQTAISDLQAMHMQHRVLNSCICCGV